MITDMTTASDGPPPDHPYAAAWWLIQRHAVLIALCQRMPGCLDHDVEPDKFPFDAGVLAATINAFDTLAASGDRADLGDRIDKRQRSGLGVRAHEPNRGDSFLPDPIGVRWGDLSRTSRGQAYTSIV